MAGGFAERCNIKQLLNRTTVGRGLIYCMAIPLAWFLMDSGVLFAVHTPLHVSFFVVFLLFIFFDGILVAFSNVADIDSGGVNLVAMQYGIAIDDNIRNYFNSLHILFFDLSMVIFNPLLAYLGLLVGQKTVIAEGSSIPVTIVDESVARGRGPGGGGAGGATGRGGRVARKQSRSRGCGCECGWELMSQAMSRSSHLLTFSFLSLPSFPPAG